MNLVIKKATLSIIKEDKTAGKIIIASGIHYEPRLIGKDKEDILQLRGEGRLTIVCVEEWERDMPPQELPDRPQSRERAAMNFCAANGINVFLVDGDITEVYKKSRYFGKKEGDLLVAFHYGFANVATSSLFGEDKFDLYELIKQVANYIILLRNTNLKRADLLKLDPHSEIATRALEDANSFLQPLFRKARDIDIEEIEKKFKESLDKSVFLVDGTPDILHHKFMAISNHLMTVRNEIIAERIKEIFIKHFESTPTIYVVLEHDHYDPVKTRIINMLTKLKFRIQTSEQTRGVVTVRDD